MRQGTVLLLVVIGLAGLAYMTRGTLAAAGLKLLEKFEGRERRAYKDSAGLWTIGIGHLIKPDEMAKYVGRVVTIDGKPRGSIEITDAEVDRLAQQDTAIAEAWVRRLVTVPLTENQRHALVSFVFNLGGGSLASSTLLRKLNASDYEGAAGEFPKWNKARVNGVLTEVKGLTARRLAEQVLFRTA